MQKVVLYIKPVLSSSNSTQVFQRVDLMEEELIELTQVIQDARDIEKIFTDYSKTFNLPASATNNKIFSHWYDPDIIGFNNLQYADSRIELDHFHFKFGKIKLEEVVMKNKKPFMYKVTFFGNTLTLTDLIGEDLLENLPYLQNFNFSSTSATVKDGLENGLDITVDGVTYNNAIIYPLIGHSVSYIIDDTNNGDNGLNVSTVQPDNNTERGVVPPDLKPAIKIQHIIKAIEVRYGLTFKTTEFLDSTALDNLYLWLHRDKGQLTSISSVDITNHDFTCISTLVSCQHFDSTNQFSYFDNVSSPTTNGGVFRMEYTHSQGLAQPEEFNFQAQITPSSSTLQYSIDIVDFDTGEVYSTNENIIGTQPVGRGFGDVANGVPMSVNEVIRVFLRIRCNFSMTFDVAINVDHKFWEYGYQSQRSFTAIYESNNSSISLNSDVSILEQMPEMKVLDFLRSIFRMHNLTAFIDFNNKVVVKTLDSFYQSGQLIDITKYVKTDEHIVSSIVPYSEVDLEYSDPETILATRFQLNNSRKYGELNYQSGFTKEQKYEIEIPFEHMVFERLQDLTDSDLSTIQIGASIDSDLNPTIGDPLLFYGIHQTSADPLNFVYSSRSDVYGALVPSGQRFLLTSYWIPSMNNELGTPTTPPAYNLNFGSEINTYQLTDYAGNNNSLFQLYYQNYILRIFNTKTRLFKYDAILPLKVILQLSLDDKIVIDGRVFTINKMTTKLTSGESSLELLSEAPYQTVTATASVSYDNSNYCTNGASDPSPTFTPAGGTFTSS